MIGTPSIIAKVRRSRRSCTNSLRSTATMRPQDRAKKPPAPLLEIVGGMLGQRDEDILEAGCDRRHRPSRVAGMLGQPGGQVGPSPSVLGADVQRIAEC